MSIFKKFNFFRKKQSAPETRRSHPEGEAAHGRSLEERLNERSARPMDFLDIFQGSLGDATAEMMLAEFLMEAHRKKIALEDVGIILRGWNPKEWLSKTAEIKPNVAQYFVARTEAPKKLFLTPVVAEFVRKTAKTHGLDLS